MSEISGSSILDQAHFNPSSVKQGVNYGNTVFTDKQSNDLTSEDFLNLMITQLKNQDFMNPSSDTEFLSQLAQFTSMQYMQELANYSKQNYVSALIGQTITASKFKVDGSLDSTTGVVTKISLVDDEYTIYIGDKSYTLDQIMEIGVTSKPSTPTTPPTEEETETDYSQSSFLMSLLGQQVTVKNSSGEEISGVVQRVSMAEGMKFQVDGEWYSLSDFVSVDVPEENAGEPDEEDEEIIQVLNPDETSTILDTNINTNGAEESISIQDGVESGIITPEMSEA